MSMEEPVPPQNTPTPNPPSITQNLPPQPPPVQSKKRPLDTSALQNSSYSKMRAVLRDLRPHFIEVLRASDFRNCKAAHGIEEQMKLLMDLYKQMTAETVSIGQKPLSGEKQDGQKTQQLPEDVRLAEQPQPDRVTAKSSENKHSPSGNASETQRSADSPIDGSYIVGGSAFGWNFITYSGNSPVYYGITKESFRTAQVKLWE